MTIGRRGKLILSFVVLFGLIAAWQGFRYWWYHGYSIGERTGIIRKISVRGSPVCKYIPKDVAALTKSIEHFKKYLAARPDDDKAAKFLVTTYMNAQKYDEAIGYFKDFIASHPKDAQAVQTVAMLYAKKGDYENSIDWQKKRAVLEPTNADVFYTMGVTAWQKSYDSPGNDVSPEHGLAPEKRREILDFGMASLDKAIELNPDYFEAMLYKNLVYRQYARIEGDPAKVAELTAKATEWQTKALEIRKKVQDKLKLEQANKNPLEAM